MRRTDKQVNDPAVIAGLFRSGRICRLGLVYHGEPYVVPVNYGYADNAIYIHSAAVGRKISIIKRHSRVCFEIESPVEIVEHAEPCRWGTKARSLVGYGVCEIVTDLSAKRQGLDIIMRHCGKRGSCVYDQKDLEAVVIVRVAIASVTCKQVGQWEEGGVAQQ